MIGQATVLTGSRPYSRVEVGRMGDPNVDNTPDSEDRSSPESELYMMEGRTYVLCSVEFPSTRWIETDEVADLNEWR